MSQRALITGITGQDGSYLAEFLLDKGYEVHGLVRGPGDAVGENLWRVQDRVSLHRGDLLDADSLHRAVRICEPDEIYNLAAMSHVGASWDQATLTAECTAVGVARILDAVREECPQARFFQASSSEIFPRAGAEPLTELSPICPSTPYGAAKAYGKFVTSAFREGFGLFACSAILFNHESPRRGLEFVTRKVTHGVAAIKLGLADELTLGNLDGRRDWGYAPEYAEAMWLMLQQEDPEDFVIGTGEDHSVRELVELAFHEVGLEPEEYVRRDAGSTRWKDRGYAVADPTRARELLGWSATTPFAEVVQKMVAADLRRLRSSQVG